MTSPSLEQLVAEYQSAAARHGSATTARTANVAAEKVATIYRELRERGERGRLLPLLEDSNPSVRSWAGAHALEFAAERAVPVLEALAEGPRGAMRLTATVTLAEWRAGRLKLS